MSIEDLLPDTISETHQVDPRYAESIGGGMRCMECGRVYMYDKSGKLNENPEFIEVITTGRCIGCGGYVVEAISLMNESVEKHEMRKPNLITDAKKPRRRGKR